MLLTLAVVGSSLGLLFGRLATTEYTADRLLMVSPQGGQSLADLVQGGDLAASRAQSLAYVGSAAPSLYQALTRAGIELSTANQYLVSARVPTDTTYIEVQAKGPTPDLTLKLAAAAAAQLIEANNNWGGTNTTRTTARIDVQDITPAGLQQETNPTRPPKWLGPLGGAVLLSLLGYFIIVLRNFLNPTVGHALNLGEVLPFPVIGVLPAEHHDDETDPVSTVEHSMVVARYGLMPATAGARIVLIAAVDGDSDARLVLTLARALADMGRSVVMVDADLHNPSLSPRVNGDLAALLENGGNAIEAIESWGDPPLYVLPTSKHSNATRLLLSRESELVFQQLREAGDFILVSGASASNGPDFAAAADLSDEVLLIADPSTPVDRVLAATATLRDGSVTGLLVRLPRQHGWTTPRAHHPARLRFRGPN